MAGETFGAGEAVVMDLGDGHGPFFATVVSREYEYSRYSGDEVTILTFDCGPGEQVRLTVEEAKDAVARADAAPLPPDYAAYLESWPAAGRI
jgi:hypothetical protein